VGDAARDNGPLAAGGRYDHLVEDIGGGEPQLGAVGFAAGIERVLMASGAAEPAEAAVARRGAYLAIAQPALLGEGLLLAQQLRAQGLATLMDYDGKSLKAQLREADKARCRFAAILGEAELKQRALTIKDLEQGSQDTVAFDQAAAELQRRAHAGTTAKGCHRG